MKLRFLPNESCRQAAILATRFGLLTRYPPPLTLEMLAVGGAQLIAVLPVTTGAELPQTTEDGYINTDVESRLGEAKYI